MDADEILVLVLVLLRLVVEEIVKVGGDILRLCPREIGCAEREVREARS